MTTSARLGPCHIPALAAPASYGKTGENMRFSRKALIGLPLVLCPFVADIRPLAASGEAARLSLLIENGQSSPIDLVWDGPRYVQELDLVMRSAPSSVDDGLLDLTTGAAADLDWTGVSMVEEDWRYNIFGQLVRSRYF